MADTVACPICSHHFPCSSIYEHANGCLKGHLKAAISMPEKETLKRARDDFEEVTPEQLAELDRMDPPCQQQLYILELENGKYYVGKSNDASARIEQHKQGKGADWTRLHAFKRIVEIRRLVDNLEEDKVVKKLMLQYGIANVRGGSYSGIELSVESIAVLERELSTAQDRCFYCSKKGHLLRQCPERSGVRNNNSRICSRCGRSSHSVESCFAKTTISGHPLTVPQPVPHQVLPRQQQKQHGGPPRRSPVTQRRYVHMPTVVVMSSHEEEDESEDSSGDDIEEYEHEEEAVFYDDYGGYSDDDDY